MSFRAVSPYMGSKKDEASAEYGAFSGQPKMRKSASTKSDFRTQSAVHIYRQSKAQERPSYKELPKFTHANMAVIHPAPKPQAMRPSVSQPNFNIQADSVKFKTKQKVESKLKVLPDHLIRAPQPKNKKPSASASQQ